MIRWRINLLESDLAAGALLLVLTISLSLNVVLCWERSALLGQSHPTVVGVGTRLRFLPVRDFHGNVTRIMFNGVPRTFVYVMSPSCMYCKQNYASVLQVAQKLQQVRLLGVVAPGTSAGADFTLHDYPFPMFVAQTETTALGFGTTPQLLLVASDGRVEKRWLGVWSPTTIKEIIRAAQAK